MSAHKKYYFEPDYAVAPGETLREVMESRNMSQKELSIRTGLTVQTLNRIFKGDQPIGSDQWQLHLDFKAYDFSYSKELLNHW